MTRSNRWCYVSGCHTGYKNDIAMRKRNGQKNPSLFQCPRNPPELLQRWRQKLPRRESVFSYNDTICALHFTSNCVLGYYETLMPDGSIHRIERGRPKLRENAVPTIFPDLHKYLSHHKKRKPPKERSPIIKDVTKTHGRQNAVELRAISNIPDEHPPHEPNSPSANSSRKNTVKPSGIISEVQDLLLKEDFNFYHLKLCLNEVKKPSWWSINYVPDFVICAKWNDDYNVDRRLVIDADLNVKVYLQDKSVGIENKISSLNHLSNLIDMIDKFIFE